ncbi:hypothetical protein N0V90_005070 [Kalmusia sp. IMI 367209]|nr:hypothetical protein N0V90_005070 [Kalmusia sp. IMI 367209]
MVPQSLLPAIETPFYGWEKILFTPQTAAQIQPYLGHDPIDTFLPHQKSFQAPYEVVPIEGKGIGVRATRKIKKWETIMVDQASLVMDLDLERAFSAKENRELLSKGVGRLRVPEVVTNLSSKHGSGQGEKEEQRDSDSEEGWLEEDIMRTNAFGSEIAGKQCRALFPLISRINHACNPNAYVLFSRDGIAMAIKAYRTIRAGEELSISYATLGQPFARRQETLKRWGFTCTCALCSLPAAEKTASDMRRALIAKSETKAVQLYGEGKTVEAIELAEETLEMMREEGLEGTEADQLVLLAKMWLGVGEREAAERYGRESWERLRGMGFLGEVRDEEWELEGFLGMVGEGVREVLRGDE